MPSPYELSTLEGLPKQCWLFDAHEQHRFRSIVMKWRKENPTATIEKQILIEGLIRCHLWEQRLIDRRRFWNGTATDYRVLDGRKQVDVSDEDQTRKDKEWLQYMPLIQRWKQDYLKLALANSIDVQVVNDLSSLFSAIDAEDKQRIRCGCRSINGNGEK